jgi:hypothetical protein
VAELFRQCLAAAETYQRRCDRAEQRLSMTVMGLLAVIALLVVGTAGLVLFQPTRDVVTLEEQIASVVPAAGVPERLRGGPASLGAKLQELHRLEREPEYGRVPEQSRAALEDYARELAAYLQAYEAYQKTVKLPHLARNPEELARYEKSLHEFTLPAEYAKPWHDTRLARRLEEARREYTALHQAEDDVIRRIHEQVKETRRLSQEGNKFGAEMDAGKAPPERVLDDWFSAVASQLQPPPLLPPGDPIPGVSGLTYERLDHLPRVRQERALWASAQAVLRALADELRGRVRKA